MFLFKEKNVKKHLNDLNHKNTGYEKINTIDI